MESEMSPVSLNWQPWLQGSLDFKNEKEKEKKNQGDTWSTCMDQIMRNWVVTWEFIHKSRSERFSQK